VVQPHGRRPGGQVGDRRLAESQPPRKLATLSGGESYGTTRAGLILKAGDDLTFDGVLLIGLVGDAPGHEMPYVVTLPTMAAAAWYHQRIDRAGRGAEQVYREAVAFARTDYVSALIKARACRRRSGGASPNGCRP